MISVGMALLAVIVFVWVLPSFGSFPAQILLVVSSISGAFAMILACVYAYSLVVRNPIIDIPQMALTHGVLNSFGFALCGLLAWSVVNVPETGERGNRGTGEQGNGGTGEQGNRGTGERGKAKKRVERIDSAFHWFPCSYTGTFRIRGCLTV